MITLCSEHNSHQNNRRCIYSKLLLSNDYLVEFSLKRNKKQLNFFLLAFQKNININEC